jgi:hypothetical protein
MINIKVQTSFADTLTFLNDVERRQLPFATAKALTLTAKIAEKEIYGEMAKQFDRPTPMTMRSLRTKPATKQDLTARVFLKGVELGGKNPNSMFEIIGHQFEGGTRNRKRIEQLFTSYGLISSSEYLVPGEGARLDRYGNISRGQLQQIVSQLGISRDAAQNSTRSARSARNVKKAGAMFWSRGDHLPRGVWVRQGAFVKPVLLVARTPHYRQRIDMERVGEDVTRREFQGVFDKTLNDALRSAR